MNQLEVGLPEKIQKALSGSPDLIVKTYFVQEKLELTCMYLSTLADKKLIDELVISGMITPCQPLKDHTPVQWLLSLFKQAELKKVSGVESCLKEILDGQCLVIPVGTEAVSIDVRSLEQRAVAEPDTESVVRGPREGFVEDYSRNLSLIRKRLKSTALVIEKMTIGTETQTTVCLLYMRGKAEPQIIDQFRTRLKAIHTDSILESAFIEEYIQEKTLTPFPQFLASERPDAIVAKLLEGQAVVLTDGTPVLLAGPIHFFQMFSATEDYYQRADIATLLRWLRMLAFLISIFTPALYISVASYHQELLPSSMLANLASQREGVPFPGVVEAFAMLIVFEIIREAGLRMPRIAGQAISIVGALVLGQAAVEAGLVSAAMVIVVSLTAIANFVAPTYGFGIAQRIIQFAFMGLAGTLGFFGIMCGVFFLLVHLMSLEPFGTPYFSPVAPLKLKEWRDSILRLPRPMMKQQRQKE
ncbi:spore germination protein [Paenibacillus sp. BK720]|uniref:spore germination protein n=1 Tax=Paenibacillus sp. BK720 TaxID=2587092 RepID=UPI00141FE85A|nr:spore germination protein [Paenibacillus sp. BK720]NIK68396.1 spore germination protein KA [Paenibacillus sp. BK720]